MPWGPGAQGVDRRRRVGDCGRFSMNERRLAQVTTAAVIFLVANSLLVKASPPVILLTEVERSAARGGCAQVLDFCIGSVTNCSDPRNWTNSCAFDAQTGLCEQCFQTTNIWTACKPLDEGSGYQCGVDSLGTDPWCGQERKSFKDPVTGCAVGCGTVGQNCGKQMPQTRCGVNCP